MRKDFLFSIIGHLVLMTIVIVINPSTGVLRPKPSDFITASIYELPGSASTKPVETPSIKTLAAGETFEDEEIAFNAKPKVSDKTEKIKTEKKTEKKTDPKPEKPKAKTDGKGGIEVSTKVGSGTGEGEGIGSGDLPYNLGMVESLIERAWRNPVTSPTRISCVIFLQIDRSGMLLGEPTVEKSSGISSFDQSTIFAIKRVAQFPPFPTDFDYDYINLHLEFEYAP